MDESPLVGQPTSDDELDWIKFWREMRRVSPAVLNDAARQIATVSGVVATLYVSMLTALRTTQSFEALSRSGKIIFLVPPSVWVLAMLAAIAALFPFQLDAFPDSAPSIQTAFNRMTQFKFKCLFVSCLFLVFGVVIAGYSALFVLN